MNGAQLLVVDDEPNIRLTLRANLERRGFRIFEASDGVEALSVLEKNDVPLMITDLKMPNMDGKTLLKNVFQNHPHVKSIVISAHGTVQDAVEIMRLGAFDYITKPFDVEEVEEVVRRALGHADSEEEPRLTLHGAGNLQPLVGKSPQMAAVMETVRQVAPSDSHVLILGETGTGKELLARTIHGLSPRRDKPFVAVNCAALSPQLLASELFGHERGAFTGAVRRHLGRFELAHGGTLFLDEIGDVPLEMQVKLLRVIQERTFERVGGDETLKTDFRLVAATHRDLPTEIKKGNFREDLYYRLSVIPLELPPLRNRAGDIPLLCAYFLKLVAEKSKLSPKHFSEGALQHLSAYPWPGNVRELENIVERCVILSKGSEIPLEMLPRNILEGPAAVAALSAPASAQTPGTGAGLSGVREKQREMEKALILSALKEEGGNRSFAARRIGWCRKTLYNKMKELGLE